jgi:primosomal protein N' (replication factor Y)
MTCVAVMPLVRTRAFDEPFEYTLPAELEGLVDEGSLVVAPLGAQTVLGLVLERRPTPRHAGVLAPLDDVLDLPRVPADLLDLAGRIADYYLAPLPAALALVAPPTAALRIERRYALTDAGRAAAEAGDEALLALDGAAARGGAVTRAAQRFRRRGWLRTSYDVHVVGLVDRGPCLARGEAPPPPRSGPRQRAALEALERAGPTSERELRASTGINTAGLRRLVEAGAVIELPAGPCPAADAGGEPRTSRAVDRAPVPEAAATAAARRLACAAGRQLADLLPEQRRALDAVLCEARAGDEVLLHGVTGSGKTEVYLQAAAAMLEAGRTVLILVPEIGLTGQTVERVRERFGAEGVAVMHSGLAAGERLATYVAIARGERRIVVGARSAVFAPLPGLGLIVVDEEHDTSYKQENVPAYDARRAARWRAEAAGAVVLLATATPSLEAYARVALHVDLPRRVDGSSPPPLEIVDMRDRHDVFSPELAAALTATLEAGEKAILFQNRRGYASSLACDHCGFVWECPRCDVSLTLFAGGKGLRCRTCGHSEPAPAVCPSCGSADVVRYGFGTERVEREVKALAPGVPLLRLDSDVAASHARLRAVLDGFGRAGPAVLVGTQMIAKGHHFPDVTLVGVVNADLTLHFPDFRAEERTFAMLVQVGGRSGRGPGGGRVIVQTLDPEARAIARAASGEWERFYAEELERRRKLGYPPATHLVGLEVSSASADKAEKGGVYVARKVAELLGDGAQVLGPGPLWRERDRSVCRTLVKTTALPSTLELLGPWVARYATRFSARGARLVADVDPEWL